MRKIKNFNCYFLGHHLLTSKKITHHVKEYKCKRCNCQYTTNSNGKLIELTPKYKEINATLSKMYSKKIKQLNAKKLNNY
ncbi:MAG: hypothetical protein EVB11_03465 [Winogradskyella sp.]|nr:MAG: hypothetical protein EVB11_03465 [Winogradskyella sp.]